MWQSIPFWSFSRNYAQGCKNYSTVCVNSSTVSPGGGAFRWGLRGGAFSSKRLGCASFSLTGQTLAHRFGCAFSSVQFSRSVVSDSWRPNGSQHARPPCPSPTPGVYPNPCPLSQWCHPAISSSVVPFSSCPNPSQIQGLFQWVNSSHEVAISVVQSSVIC